MSEMLEKARKFILDNAAETDGTYRPSYHACPPCGWTNDPNGFCCIDGVYHVFYQHYPYEPRWNDMHWGLWTSTDLCHWRDEPVAMAPDKIWDSFGCFSGTALTMDRGKTAVMYTGVHTVEGRNWQEQCLAFWQDGQMIKDAGNPVIPASLVPDIREDDCRDPKLIKTADGYRVVLAARKKNGEGKLITLSSGDLKNWHYDGDFADTIGEMPECPDCFELDGKTVIMYSVINADKAKFTTSRPVVLSAGCTNHTGDRFTGGEEQPADVGTDFYAAETAGTPDGRRLMIGWLSSWNGDYPTRRLGHGWCGMMSLPREVTLRNERLMIRPARELRLLRHDAKKAEITDDGVWQPLARSRHMEAELDVQCENGASFEVRLLASGDEFTRLYWENGSLTIDRTASGYPIGSQKDGGSFTVSCPTADGHVRLDVYIDGCAVEVFMTDHGQAASVLAFPTKTENIFAVRTQNAAMTACLFDMKG